MSDMLPPPPDDPNWPSQPPPPPRPPDDSGWPSQPPPEPPPLADPSSVVGVPGARTALLGTGETVALASPGTRFTARITDMAILFIVALILQRVSEFGLHSVAAVVAAVSSAAYEIAFIAIKGQTPGKMATLIRIVRAGDGAVPGWGSSAARWALPFVVSQATVFAWNIWAERTTTSVILSAILLIVSAEAAEGLVYASLLWHKRRQGWHDMVARTLVINTPEQTAQSNRVAIRVGIAVAALAVLLPFLLYLAFVSAFGP